MNKSIYKTVVFLIIFVFLFPNIIFADVKPNIYKIDGEEYTYMMDNFDNSTDGPEVKDVTLELSGFIKENLADEDIDVSELTVNEKYGWYEYEQDGTNWVVLGAATHELLDENKNKNGIDWYLRSKFEHIHYFNLGDSVEFTYNNETFYGKVLDYGEEKDYFPQLFGYKGKTNVISIYFGPNETAEALEGMNRLQGDKISASTDASFRENANISGKVSKNFFVELITKFIRGLGDWLQNIINRKSTLAEILHIQNLKLTQMKH